MYPFFEIFFGARIYTFGIALALCFFFFLWNLKRLGKRFGYRFTIFSQNILWFFVSIFVFSRLFYVVSQWNNTKFIRDPFEFLIMSEYNFSLFGAIFGFLIVLRILTGLEKTSVRRYIDGAVLSFLFIMVIGYIGALFGGQVYGRETMFGIELNYTNPNSPVPQVPVFPLPIVYALGSFLIFSGLYIVSLFVKMRGFIGYMGMLLFGTLLLIFESFSGKQDIFSLETNFNLPQVFSLILIIWSGYQLYIISKDTSSTKNSEDA